MRKMSKLKRWGVRSLILAGAGLALGLASKYDSVTETREERERQIRSESVTMQISPTEEYLLRDTNRDGRVDEVYAHYLRSYFKGRHPEPAYRARGYTPADGTNFPEVMSEDREKRINEFYVAHQKAKDLFVGPAQ